MSAGKEEGGWFHMKVGLWQGCATSLWPFNLFMDRVVRKVNAGTLPQVYQGWEGLRDDSVTVC